MGLCEPTVGRKLVPYTTIRARMEKKDLRFEREARQRAAQFDGIAVDGVRAIPSQYAPLTHEQRQALIRQPIVFNYYGSKSSGGTGVCDESRMNRVYSTKPSRIQDGDSHD